MNPSIEKLHSRLSHTVKGSETAAFELIAALLAGGHILIEGPPGVGKTTLAKTLADSLLGEFCRVQFTPDLLPSDLLGYSMFLQDSGRFDFIEGPVFTNLLLADEINRTSPRIQSALLECMNEGQVTVDGKTHQLPDMFHVLATQNNQFTAGTFPLPEPQLDRFLISIELNLPAPETQVAMLEYHIGSANGSNGGSVASVGEFEGWKEAVREIHMSKEVCQYVVRLCEGIRQSKEIASGVSNRSAIALSRMAQSIAFLNDRSAVYPEDVQRSLVPVFVHRIALASARLGPQDPSRQRRNAVSLLNDLMESVVVD